MLTALPGEGQRQSVSHEDIPKSCPLNHASSHKLWADACLLVGPYASCSGELHLSALGKRHVFIAGRCSGPPFDIKQWLDQSLCLSLKPTGRKAKVGASLPHLVWVASSLEELIPENRGPRTVSDHSGGEITRPGVNSSGGLKEGISGALLRVSTPGPRARAGVEGGAEGWEQREEGRLQWVWKVSHPIPRLTQMWASATQR